MPGETYPRDLRGYGRNPPDPKWPGGARLALSVGLMERRVLEAGGTIARPIFSFPGGRRFHFTDPNGHELAVWSDK